MSAHEPRLIAVCGARDGVGKSIFAVNFALSLLKETRKRVLILDIDTESCGDVQRLLSLGTAKSFTDFAPYIDRLKSEQIRQYITAHGAGIGVLPIASKPGEGAGLDPEVLGRILQLVKPHMRLSNC